MSRPVRLPSLALPFAIVGGVGGALTARAFGPHPFDFQEGGLVIVLTTMLLAGRLGRRLGHRFQQGLPVRPSLVEVVGRTLVTGAMNGLFLLGFLVMVNLGLPENDCTLVVFPGAVCAAMLGGLISVAFLPSLLVLTAAHRRILSVRPGSLAATVFVRRVWLLTSGIVAAHVAAVMGATRRLSAWHAPAGWADMLAAAGMAAAVVAMALVAAEVADFGRLRAAARAVAGLTSLETLSPPPTLGPVAADFLDLGVGTSRFVSLGSGRDPYRAVDLAIPRIDGDPAGVRRTLLRSAREDALALLLLLAPVLLALAWWRIA